MKCPNCGAKLESNSLYCETCGEDIHIVPDYENDGNEFVDDILAQITDEANRIREKETQKRRKERTSQRKRKRRAVIQRCVLLVLFGVVLIFGVICWISIKRQNSFDYQIYLARKYNEEQKVDLAIRAYNRALDLQPLDISTKFELADVYFLSNKSVEYEYLLREIVTDENAQTDQLMSAYGKIIGLYKSQGKYQAIHNLLGFCKNETVKAHYKDYYALPPELSLKEGYYTEVTPLTITASGNGIIYYTLDGTVPDEYCSVYQGPFVLDEGEYDLSTIFINEYGIRSDVVTAKYHIEFENLPAPRINVLSGEYRTPEDIEVVGDAEGVYYTTDGSMPSVDGIPYTGPISMPLGTTWFRFVQIKDQRVSEITEIQVTLNLQTKFHVEDAQRVLTEYAESQGKSNIFFNYVKIISIEDVGSFYVLEECFRESEYVTIKTGNVYAVNALDGIIFVLEIDEFGIYNLIDLISPEEDGEVNYVQNY